MMILLLTIIYIWSVEEECFSSSANLCVCLVLSNDIFF